MERKYVAILVNSTPSYYYILPFFFGMLRRYAPALQWPVYLATEVPENPICIRVRDEFGVKLQRIRKEDAGFLNSRRAALEFLTDYEYCLPLQDDFILEAAMDANAIQRVLDLMDLYPNLASARLMPCPGPEISDPDFAPDWKQLTPADSYGFVFQATLWRTAACLEWYRHICKVLESIAPTATTSASHRKQIEVTMNLAEAPSGQREFWLLTEEMHWQHIAWIRRGTQPNAVYLSPFPYRPTAIVRGKFEDWARLLQRREDLEG